MAKKEKSRLVDNVALIVIVAIAIVPAVLIFGWFIIFAIRLCFRWY